MNAFHRWVQVILPKRENGRLVFEKFDIDSTWTDTFTPLFPRLSGMDDQSRSQLADDCYRISDCVQDKLTSQGQTREMPASSIVR